MKKRELKTNKYELSLISLLILFIIFLVVFNLRIIRDLDFAISKEIYRIHNPVLDEIFIFLNYLGNFFVAAAVFFIISLYFIYKKKNQKALFFGSTIFFTFAIVEILKLFFRRLRPYPSMVNAAGFSFPSFHASLAIVSSLCIIYLFRDEIKNKFVRLIFSLAMIITAFLISLSRIYFNIHWLSDVAAGIFIGIIVYSASIIIKKNNLLE